MNTDNRPLTRYETALLKYLEFNLIGLVKSIEPHLAEGTNKEEVYDLAHRVLEEMHDSITLPNGLPAQTSK